VQADKMGVKTALVNARLSDHSAKGYMRFKCFFAPLLSKFDVIAAQSAGDQERFQRVSPQSNVVNCGNLKFDQSVPADLAAADLTECFGSGKIKVLLGASTHSGEEALIAKSFQTLFQQDESLRLVLIPRHAERGGEVADMLAKMNIPVFQRSCGVKHGSGETLCLLADTTGEMLKFMQTADVVIMGKSLAGHDERHNLIEPALLGKPVVTGNVLRNFRYILKVLSENNAVFCCGDAELPDVLAPLISSAELREIQGKKALSAISCHRGAIDRAIDALESLKA
jgi:3-deoxy-D-manno-octulosonic-acid transferase